MLPCQVWGDCFTDSYLSGQWTHSQSEMNAVENLPTVVLSGHCSHTMCTHTQCSLRTISWACSVVPANCYIVASEFKVMRSCLLDAAAIAPSCSLKAPKAVGEQFNLSRIQQPFPVNYYRGSHFVFLYRSQVLWEKVITCLEPMGRFLVDFCFPPWLSKEMEDVSLLQSCVKCQRGS